MKKFVSFATAVALVGGVATSCQKHNTLSEAEKAEGWQLLFDGETLNGWRSFNETELLGGWHVVDGCIQAKGEGGDASGYIVTDKQYANFELVWDWKLTHGGNSGMLYHVVEHPKFKVPYVTGPEYQLIDNEGWEEVNAPTKLEEWQKLGVDYAMHLPDYSKMKVNPVGEWNSSKIVYDNGHVEHWLNGEKILEFEAYTEDWFAKKASGKWGTATEYGLSHTGVICLQDHGDPASFRNIKIKELPEKRAGQKVSLFNGKDLTGWELFGSMRVSVDKDGNLVTENGEDLKYGYLGTREYYKDFDLTVEFKQMSNGNSGLFFHSFVEGGYENNIVNGWQCEVAPKGNDTGGVYESYGRGWLKQIPDEKESILKEGEWNTLRLRVEGNKVQTWLNGEAMMELDDELIGSKTGRIMLQIHDGNNIKVLWRNFNLTKL
ncbi:MAG: DUF1080 domain-containing protein [Alistipes sp.]|nr:DUF1080 domain-containing protein [Alistipes sp.]MBO5331479.1 DUF1080 domain-containing protein [Alistipes sp.]MBO5399999.1 DUF1080 domain-containing protein [Alistipes sp.]MBP3473373.1 DUF1080 domain-containing protein [Alistipes sp.]MBQ4540104.1 DUF1080 domain-containing protein [Alistipes sp.]